LIKNFTYEIILSTLWVKGSKVPLRIPLPLVAGFVGVVIVAIFML
jgi:hypothetical protein